MCPPIGGDGVPAASTAYSISTLPAFSNSSVAFDLLALFQRLLQAREHHVERSGLELDRLARLDLEPAFHRPHLGDALLHRHVVDLELGGDRGGAADQAVGRVPLLVMVM